MQRIDVYGVRYCDVVLYLSRILQNLHRNVLICDRSISKTMRNFVPVFDEFDLNREIFDYGGVGYTYLYTGNPSGGRTQEDISVAAEKGWEEPPSGRPEELKRAIDEDDDAFDIMIVLSDASAALADFWDEERHDRQISLFITDEYPENIYEMRSTLKAINKNAGYMGEDRAGNSNGKRLFVVRDYTGTAKTIINELEMTAGASKSFLIPWSRTDRRLEMMAAYNDGFRFVGMSDKLCCLLEELCDGLGIDTSDSDYRKAFIKAGKGKRT